MRALPTTVCDRYSPSSRLEIMSRMRANSRGLLSASCTLARAARLRNLRASVAAYSNVSSMRAMCRLSRSLPWPRWNSSSRPGPFFARVSRRVSIRRPLLE